MKTVARYLVYFGLLLLISTTTILNSHADSSTPIISEYNTKVETNFLNINLAFMKFGNDQSQIVIGAFKDKVFVSNRESSKISVYKIKKNSTEILFDFNQSIQLPSVKNAKNYILDIEALSTTRFAVTKVEFFDDPSECSVMQLYLYDTKTQKTESMFTSKPCLGGVGAWSEIAGRIAVDHKKSTLYVSGGNVLTDLYANTFPRPGLCCLSGTYEQNIKKTNLFGSITSVDLNSKKQKKISSGHRAPQGLEFDSIRNILFSTEHGPRGGDELNLIKQGRNYGWPYVSFGREYLTEQKNAVNNFQIKPKTNSHNGFTEPLYSWVPSIAPSQLVVVNSTNPLSLFWKGDILVSSLKDKSIRRIRLGAANQFIYDERIEIGKRIRDLEPIDEGLIASTDDGYLIIIGPNPADVNGVFPAK